MKITYHGPKNHQTQLARGLSFEDVVDLLWEDALVVVDDRKDYGELRYNAFLPDAKGRFLQCYVYMARRCYAHHQFSPCQSQRKEAL